MQSSDQFQEWLRVRIRERSRLSGPRLLGRLESRTRSDARPQSVREATPLPFLFYVIEVVVCLRCHEMQLFNSEEVTAISILGLLRWPSTDDISIHLMKLTNAMEIPPVFETV